MSATLTFTPEQRDLLASLAAHLRAFGASGWIVGGTVRDLLLGTFNADLDVAVDGDALELARSFADASGGAWVLLDEQFGSARVVWPENNQRGWPRVLDLVRLRAATIEQDLRLRDFTINALALALEDAGQATPTLLIDPLGGAEDLRRGLLRATGPQAIVDDPLRMLRAVRLAAALGLRIADPLAAEIAARRGLIGEVSAERIRDELLKLLALSNAGGWVRFLDEVGLLTTLIPELEPGRDCEQPSAHALPVLGHLLEAIVATDWLLGQIDRRDPSPLTPLPSGERGTGSRLAPPLGRGTGSRLAPPLPTWERGLGGEGDRRATDTQVASSIWAMGSLLVQPLALHVFPELDARLPHADRLRVRLSEMVDGVPRVALFRLAVLLHDVAKPQTKAIKPEGGISFYDHQVIGAEVAWQIARRLRISRAGSEYVRQIVREHMRPGQLSELGPELTPRAVYRFFRATGDAGPDVLLHSLCDHLAVKGPMLARAGWEWHIGWTARMLEIFYDETEQIRPEPLLRGGDVMRELGLDPGPLIGRVLEDVREAQAAGDVRTRDEAIDWARRFVQDTAATSQA